ncbi:hypothetical protein WJX74_009693 [Apatococcus lobatus]|uniref:Uncharacterized protein n=1 Tax=Apatococcus lobatus TaxID=904363 RepID=A0AAW1QZX2_9CHLO
MEHYESLDNWKQTLRQTCIAYCNADDAVKELGKELKPLRDTVKECSHKVVGLLQERNEKRCDIHDHSVSLKLDCRKSKKMPSKQQIRERCLEFCGDDDKGEELFAYLMVPVCSDRTRLLRKKLQGAPRPPVFVDAVNDMLEEMELQAHEPRDE